MKLMFCNKLFATCAGAALLAMVSYAAFRVGQVSATREHLRNLAFISLRVIEPAVRLSELEAENPGNLPRSLVVHAESSIAMLAGYSMIFDPNWKNMAIDSKNILCVIAKNRERHRAFQAPSRLYDDALMTHLEKFHKATAKEAGDSATAKERVACSLRKPGSEE